MSFISSPHAFVALSVRLWSPKVIKITIDFFSIFYASHSSFLFLSTHLFFLLFTVIYTKNLTLSKSGISFMFLKSKYTKCSAAIGITIKYVRWTTLPPIAEQCNLLPWDGSDCPIPGIAFYTNTATSLAARNVLDSETLTKYCQHCKQRNTTWATGATTTKVHRISFVSRRLIYGTNSVRSYTSLGRIPCADLGTNDFRIDLHPSSLLFMFSMKDWSKRHKILLDETRWQMKTSRYFFKNLIKEKIFFCLHILIISSYKTSPRNRSQCIVFYDFSF